MDISHKAKTILLVDDEYQITFFMEKLLVLEGYRVAVANNGVSAIDTVKLNPESIDLVLLDVVMPDMTGLEVYCRLIEFKPDLPILMMSAYPKEQFELNDIPFIQKPAHPDELFNAIRGILGKQ